MKQLFTYMALALCLATSCQKKKTTTDNIDQLKKDILQDVAYDICAASYQELYANAQTLESSTLNLQSSVNDANLTACRTAWTRIRSTWETTESWLFGPISANNIDPRIDTWPVDFNAIDSVLLTSHPFTDGYVNNLEDALKGFHPIEYFLWGQQGNKTAAEFTPRQLEYLVALTHNLTLLSQEVAQTWSQGYAAELALAGQGSTAYLTQQSAYLELVDAMAGICDEVANGKINDPFMAQDPLLEESPFAKNSINDFTQNIQGVMVLYNGNYLQNHLGLEDLVRFYSLSLDQEIKTQHAEAMAALQQIPAPFGESIITHPILIQYAMDKINALETTLQGKLKPFILQYVR